MSKRPPMQTQIFLRLLAARRLPEPVPEHRFAAPRKWRIDWAWPDQKVALEIQGGIFSRGRHVRGGAMLKEWEKLNCGAGLGWRFLFCQPTELCHIRTIDEIEKAIKYTPCKL